MKTIDINEIVSKIVSHDEKFTCCACKKRKPLNYQNFPIKSTKVNRSNPPVFKMYFSRTCRECQTKLGQYQRLAKFKKSFHETSLTLNKHQVKYIESEEEILKNIEELEALKRLRIWDISKKEINSILNN